MAIPESELRRQIAEYIIDKGGPYTAWYVGITNQPERRLFVEHRVDKQGIFIQRQATSNAVARRVEHHFIRLLGCDGDLGGGEEDAEVVYAYKKTASTDP